MLIGPLPFASDGAWRSVLETKPTLEEQGSRENLGSIAGGPIVLSVPYVAVLPENLLPFSVLFMPRPSRTLLAAGALIVSGSVLAICFYDVSYASYPRAAVLRPRSSPKLACVEIVICELRLERP